MTVSDLQDICAMLGGVTEDIKWEHDLCFCVGGKMFLVTVPDKSPLSASFKAAEDEFEALTEREGFQPAPYLARHKWVYVDNINRLGKTEWTRLITQSYTLVKSKLPKKKQ